MSSHVAFLNTVEIPWKADQEGVEVSMNEPRRGYAVADRKGGAPVSRVVSSYEAAKELLQTVYCGNREEMIICRVTCEDEVLSVPDLGDNSPG
jgi:hypothetical protein